MVTGAVVSIEKIASLWTWEAFLPDDFGREIKDSMDTSRNLKLEMKWRLCTRPEMTKVWWCFAPPRCKIKRGTNLLKLRNQSNLCRLKSQQRSLLLEVDGLKDSSVSQLAPFTILV